MTDFKKLIADLQAAKGPNRELDAAIYRAAGYEAEYIKWGRRWVWKIRRAGEKHWLAMQSPMRELDTITDLIESEGFSWDVKASPREGYRLAEAIVYHNRTYSMAAYINVAATALCIAFVKALEAEAGE